MSGLGPFLRCGWARTGMLASTQHGRGEERGGRVHKGGLAMDRSGGASQLPAGPHLGRGVVHGPLSAKLAD